MAPDPHDPASYLLPADASERIFREQILHHPLLRGGQPQPAPVLVLVAGQPGAGKTTLIRAVMQHLHLTRGGAIELSGDTFKPFHPHWTRLTQVDDALASAATAADGRRWRAMAQEHLQAARVDLVIETAARDHTDFDALAAGAAAAGYQVEAVVVAAPQALSQISVLDRYLQMRLLYGTGRTVPAGAQVSSYTGVQDATDRIDAGHTAVDVVHVYRRGLLLAHTQHRDHQQQQWTPSPTAGTVLARERQCWTAAEAAYFHTTLRRLQATPLLSTATEELKQIRALATQLGPRLSGPAPPKAVIAGRPFPGPPPPRPRPRPPVR